MRITLAALLTIAALPLVGQAQTPQPAPAAQRLCSLFSDPTGVTTGSGDLLTLQDPFVVRCNDGAEVRASSGVYNRVAGIVTLNGNVFFQDLTRTMTSDNAVYESALGRLYATGNVVFTDKVEGTTLRGPELEYFRAMVGRPDALVNAMGRPHLTLQRPPPPDEPAPDSAPAPLEIDGDRMTIIGQNDLTVVGNVLIEDPNMRAVADEAEHRGLAETLELRGNSEIHSREYSLTGDTIFASIPEGSLREVEARGSAQMLGEELNVAAPILDLVFENDLLQRSIARSDSERAPGQQPVATSPTLRLSADSIDASMPDQRLQTVVAIGNARGETIDTTRVSVADTALADTSSQAQADEAEPGEETPPPVVAAAANDTTGVPRRDSRQPADGAAVNDTTGVPRRDSQQPADGATALTAAELVENDWIVGDTITGHFTSVVEQPDSAAIPEEGVEGEVVESVLAASAGAGDTTVVMERLVALGAARSLYHVAPEAGSPPGTQPGINFLSAAMIELQFEDGQVKVADVSGLRRGMYLEPLAAAAAPPGDETEQEGGDTPTAPTAADAEGSEGGSEPAPTVDPEESQ